MTLASFYFFPFSNFFELMLALSVYSKDDDVENGGKLSDPSEKF
jgi:hypothetical protein